MDRNGNQGLVEAPGSLDHHQLLHILREKDNTIEKLKRENEDLNNRLKELSKGSNKKSQQSRYWKKDEHERFLEALKKYGKKDVKSIAAHVGTRSPTQVRTHAQKWFLKQKRENERRGITEGEGGGNLNMNSEDSSDSYNANFHETKVKETPPVVKRDNPTYTLSPTSHSYANYNHSADTQEDIEALLNGLRRFDHETEMGKKIESIRKTFLPRKSMEDIARMLSTYHIVVDPAATDPQKKYFLYHGSTPNSCNIGYAPPNHPYSDVRNQNPYMNVPMNNQQPLRHIKPDPNGFTNSYIQTNRMPYHFQQGYDNVHHDDANIGHHNQVNVDPSEIAYIADNLLKKDAEDPKRLHNGNPTPTSNPVHHDKDDEELENELQSLQKRKNKGLGGFLGQPVGLSPTVFQTSPLGFGSPLLGQTPLGSTPLGYGFGATRGTTSPIYFVGADHNTLSKKN